jgi:hypothetical protein
LDAFHDTGFDSFTFDLAGNPTISVSGITVGAGTWGLVSTTAGSIHQDGAGNFEYALNCSNCGPSAGDVTDFTLSFNVTATGLTPASFHELSTGGSPDA